MVTARYAWVSDPKVQLLFFHRIQLPILMDFLKEVDLLSYLFRL